MVDHEVELQQHGGNGHTHLKLTDIRSSWKSGVEDDGMGSFFMSRDDGIEDGSFFMSTYRMYDDIEIFV